MTVLEDSRTREQFHLFRARRRQVLHPIRIQENIRCDVLFVFFFGRTRRIEHDPVPSSWWVCRTPRVCVNSHSFKKNCPHDWHDDRKKRAGGSLLSHAAHSRVKNVPMPTSTARNGRSGVAPATPLRSHVIPTPFGDHQRQPVLIGLIAHPPTRRPQTARWRVFRPVSAR